MKKFLTSIAIMLLGIASVTSCYDDSALWDSVNDHETRIKDLESLCKEMNTNISALQAIVNASQSGDYITDVTPLMDGADEIGYTITFAKEGKIIIYHGTDGKDGQDGAPGKDGQDGAPGKDGQDGAPGKDGVDTGATPDIGIKQGEDGVYYWTLNGEWLLADDGSRVKAVGTDGKDGEPGKDGEQGEPGKDGEQGAEGQPGTDGAPGQTGPAGKDGVTPQLKIEDDYWFVSYNQGKNWECLGKAVGEDGASGGDSLFSNVYEQDGYVYFILTNGDSYKIPTAASSGLDITFDVEQGVAIVPGTTLKVKYTITGAKGNTLVRTAGMSDGENLAIKPLDNTNGYLYIVMWDWFDGEDDTERDEPFWDELFGDVTEEDYMNTVSSALIIVTDSEGNQAIKALNFVEGVLKSVNDAYITDAVKGSLNVTLRTNITEGSYKVEIQDKATSWLSHTPTKAQMREDVLEFNVTANENDKFRSATVKLVNDMNQTLETFVIVQRSSIAGEIMSFADPRVKAVCVGKFDSNLDGELTYEEVATVTDVKNLFLLEKNIVSFDEFEYFSSVSVIPDALFQNCTKLESVKLPDSVSSIGSYAFDNCSSLKSIVIPEGVTNSEGDGYDEYNNYGYGWFSGCCSLESVTLPSTLTHLPPSGFSGCSSLKSIEIPEGVNRISYECFKGCTQLSSVRHLGAIKHIEGYAFEFCSALKHFDLSAIVGYGQEQSGLGGYAFRGSGLTSVTIPETVKKIPDAVFAGCKDLTTVVLHDNITYIGDDAFGILSYYDEDTDEKIILSCSSLKSITLPQNLESIGYSAFRGSAIEGEVIAGTSVKALVIPAKVTFIGYDAFNGCSNLSAVKMLPMYPPEISYDSFMENTAIYVDPEAIEAYKSSYYWSDYYTILPYDMMSFSLGVEFNLTGEPTYVDDTFLFPVSAKVTGNIESLDNVEEYGYFATLVEKDYYNGETRYFPVSQIDSTISGNLHVYEYMMSRDEYENKATGKCQVGAYIRLVDGTVVTYDKKEMELTYDQSLSVELKTCEITGTESDDWSNRLYFRAEYAVTGSYWFNNYGVEYEGEGYLSFDYEMSEEGTLVITGYWEYSKDVENPKMSVRINYEDRNYNWYNAEAFELTGTAE